MRKLTTDEAMLQLDLSREMKRIAARFKHPKITLIVRNPDVADGDVVLTDDDPLLAIESLQKLIAERA